VPTSNPGLAGTAPVWVDERQMTVHNGRWRKPQHGEDILGPNRPANMDNLRIQNDQMGDMSFDVLSGQHEDSRGTTFDQMADTLFNPSSFVQDIPSNPSSFLQGPLFDPSVFLQEKPWSCPEQMVETPFIAQNSQSILQEKGARLPSYMTEALYNSQNSQDLLHEGRLWSSSYSEPTRGAYFDPSLALNYSQDGSWPSYPGDPEDTTFGNRFNPQ